MDLDGIDAMSPLFPPLTLDSPTPGPNQPVFPTNASNPFSPVAPREESQGTPPSPQVNGKRKRSDPPQNTPTPQTPLRSHSNQPSPHSSRDGAGQRSMNTPSSLPNIQAITFGQPHYSPSQRAASHFDSLMDQDDINPDKDVTGFFSDNPLIDLRSEMRLGWKDLDKPKAIAIPYRATYSDQHKFQTLGKIQNMISHALGGAQPTILAPEKAEFTAKSSATYRPPWCYLVTNLLAHDIDQLVDMSFISNEYCGVQILPFSPAHSNYVASIRGLAWKKSTDSKAVESLIRNTLESHAATKRFILQFVADKNDQIPVEVIKQDNAFEWVTNSVRAYIHVLGEEDPTTTETLWRWYVNTPSAVDANVILWTNHLKNLAFNGLLNGWGKSFTFDRCTGCKSTNHPTSDCPFLKRFPQLNETNPAPARSSARGRGRAPKDRGRGRGGRGRGDSFRNTTAP